mgnify:CR=1 FL=1
MFGITIEEVTLLLTILMFIALVFNAMVIGRALEMLDEIDESIRMFLVGKLAIQSIEKMRELVEEGQEQGLFHGSTEDKLWEDEWQ